MREPRHKWDRRGLELVSSVVGNFLSCFAWWIDTLLMRNKLRMKGFLSCFWGHSLLNMRVFWIILSTVGWLGSSWCGYLLPSCFEFLFYKTKHLFWVYLCVYFFGWLWFSSFSWGCTISTGREKIELELILGGNIFLGIFIAVVFIVNLFIVQFYRWS